MTKNNSFIITITSLVFALGITYLVYNNLHQEQDTSISSSAESSSINTSEITSTSNEISISDSTIIIEDYPDDDGISWGPLYKK